MKPGSHWYTTSLMNTVVEMSSVPLMGGCNAPQSTSVMDISVSIQIQCLVQTSVAYRYSTKALYIHGVFSSYYVEYYSIPRQIGGTPVQVPELSHSRSMSPCSVKPSSQV